MDWMQPGYAPGENRKKQYAAINSRNIYERITNKRALFLCVDALDLVAQGTGAPSPRMKIRCCDYDAALPSGQKITNEVAVYIPIGKFLVMANDALNGTYLSRQKFLKTTMHQTRNHAPYFEYFGGTRKPEVISTRFAIVQGMDEEKARFAFLATSAKGVEGENGEIIPTPDSTYSASIYVNMPNDEFKEFFLIGKAYIEQYIALDLNNRLETIRQIRASHNTKNI